MVFLGHSWYDGLMAAPGLFEVDDSCAGNIEAYFVKLVLAVFLQLPARQQQKRVTDLFLKVVVKDSNGRFLFFFFFMLRTATVISAGAQLIVFSLEGWGTVSSRFRGSICAL